MAEWVHIENNTIDEYHDKLPKNWRNISSLDKANDIFLKSIGWFRVVKQHQSYDESTHKFTKYKYEILKDYVVESLDIVELTQDEINNSEKRKKEEFLNTLRETRNQLLKESDWTQLLDIQLQKSVEWIENWKIYRQSLRDLPEKYVNMNTINFNIEWPNKPDS